MHTWVASCRVPSDEVGQRLHRFEKMLKALTQIDHGLGCPIPDTVVVRKGAGHVYWCDPSSTMVTRQRFPSLQEVVESVFTQEDMDEEEGGIIAVWMSERQDNKGFIWTHEYFTREGLESFIALNGSYMTGILQRFITPRLYLGVNEVNQSLFGYYNFVEDTIAIERRYLRDCFVNSKEHPTVRANLYPTVPVLGKVDVCKSLPLSPDQLYPVSEERVEREAEGPTRLIGTVLERLASALERYRAEQHATEWFHTRPVGYIIGEFRFSVTDDRLYLINVPHVRHLGDAKSPSSGFELAKLVPTHTKMRRIQSVGGDEFALLDEQAARCDQQLTDDEWLVDEDGVLDEGGGGSEMNMGEVDVYHKHTSPIRTSTAPQDRFACPNCDLLCRRDELRPVPFSFIMNRFKDAHFSRKRRLSCVLEDTPPVMEDGYWASLPPVLRRLKTDITVIAASRAWMRRTVSLCSDCCQTMGFEAEVEKMALQLAESARPLSRALIGPHPHPPGSQPFVPSPPTCVRSDVIDGFVTTDLQAHHRELRRVERSKYKSIVLRPPSNAAPRDALLATRPAFTTTPRATSKGRRDVKANSSLPATTSLTRAARPITPPSAFVIPPRPSSAVSARIRGDPMTRDSSFPLLPSIAAPQSSTNSRLKAAYGPTKGKGIPQKGSSVVSAPIPDALKGSREEDSAALHASIDQLLAAATAYVSYGRTSPPQAPPRDAGGLEADAALVYGGANQVLSAMAARKSSGVLLTEDESAMLEAATGVRTSIL